MSIAVLFTIAESERNLSARDRWTNERLVVHSMEYVQLQKMKEILIKVSVGLGNIIQWETCEPLKDKYSIISFSDSI